MIHVVVVVICVKVVVGMVSAEVLYWALACCQVQSSTVNNCLCAAKYKQ